MFDTVNVICQKIVQPTVTKENCCVSSKYVSSMLNLEVMKA